MRLFFFLLFSGLLSLCPLTLWGQTTHTENPSVNGSISGAVWEDFCDSQADVQNCIYMPELSQPYVANGLREEGEPPITDTVVSLYAGDCPHTDAALIAETITDENGLYAFYDLAPGLYCVRVDENNPDSLLPLIPGRWTYPGLDVGEQAVTVEAGSAVNGINFGWDLTAPG